jgi:hypothetical protein
VITLPPVSADAALLPNPEFILDRQVIQKGKWKGALPEDASWENLWRFAKTYPQFNLTGKELLRGMD